MIGLLVRGAGRWSAAVGAASLFSASRFWASMGISLLVIDLGYENHPVNRSVDPQLETMLAAFRSAVSSQAGGVVALMVLASAVLAWAEGRRFVPSLDTVYAVVGLLTSLLIAAGEGGAPAVVITCVTAANVYVILYGVAVAVGVFTGWLGLLVFSGALLAVGALLTNMAEDPSVLAVYDSVAAVAQDYVAGMAGSLAGLVHAPAQEIAPVDPSLLPGGHT